jgi:CRISPR/Cas system-associated exonuclease Cas4 (RecB family)
VDRVEPEHLSASLLLGSEIHHVVALLHARRFQGRACTLDELAASFRSGIVAAHGNSRTPVVFPKSHPDLGSTIDLGVAMVDAYLEQHQPGTTVAVEQELEAPLPFDAGQNFVGVVDRLERGPSGGLSLVELKTAARALSQADVDLSMQPTAYAWLLSRVLHEQLDIRFEVITKSKSPKLLVITTARSSGDVERFLEGLEMVQRAVAAGCFPRSPSPMTCVGCEFRRRCNSRHPGNSRHPA